MRPHLRIGLFAALLASLTITSLGACASQTICDYVVCVTDGDGIGGAGGAGGTGGTGGAP